MTKLVWIQKGKNTNTWQAQLRKQQEYSIIILKTEKKQQQDRALEIKVQHNSNLNKNKPKTHDTIFVRGLSLRARAPSSCSVCEHLKEVNKGAPSRPFALRRSSRLARNTKVTENCTIISMTKTVWLKLCCPNCLVLTVGCCEDNQGLCSV